MACDCCCNRVKWYRCDTCGRLEREPAAHTARIWLRRWRFHSDACYREWLHLPDSLTIPAGELYWRPEPAGVVLH